MRKQQERKLSQVRYPASINLNTNDPSEFLAQCLQYKLDPVTALRQLSMDHPLVLTVLRLGVAKAQREIEHKARWLVKQGRADEIKDSLLRAKELAWAEQGDELRNKSQRELFKTLGELLRQYEDTLYNKWFINGTPLGAATPEQLRAAAYDEERSANGHIKNAQFYRALADLGRPGTPLLLNVSVADADRLRAKIFSGGKRQRRKASEAGLATQPRGSRTSPHATA